MIEFTLELSEVLQYLRLFLPPFFFVATASDMAIPLSLEWIREPLSLSGIIQKGPVIGLIGASSIVLSACHIICLYKRSGFGTYS